MIDLGHVRRLAAALPEVAEQPQAEGGVRLLVRGKAFAWTYLERLAEGQRRVARPEVLALRCAAEAKQSLLDGAPAMLFDDDHYRGYPAVLLRLARADEATARALLLGGWRCQAPRSLARELPANWDGCGEPLS